MNMELDRERFLDVVRLAPLVSIDLVVRDGHGRWLVGLRRNPPARGCWFVPGGRIHKGERLAHALARISRAELGVELSPGDTRLRGIYEHHYEDNAGGHDDFGTHYVVIALDIAWTVPHPPQTDAQHETFRWLATEELLGDPTVHRYTMDYVDPAMSPFAAG